MRFTVSMYLSIEADNEEVARKIADSIELVSPYQDAIFWNTLNTEVEEEPDL
jgi:hypothetical protein